MDKTKDIESYREELSQCDLCKTFHFYIDSPCGKCGAGVYWQIRDETKTNDNLISAFEFL